MMEEFKIGDMVTWESQANGTMKVKQGIIAEIVFAGEKPNREEFPFLYRLNGLGQMPRKQTSYVVMVKNKPYYPLTKNLTKGEFGMTQTLRKAVDNFVIEWERLHRKGEQKESLELYVAKKAIEWNAQKLRS